MMKRDDRCPLCTRLESRCKCEKKSAPTSAPQAGFQKREGYGIQPRGRNNNDNNNNNSNNRTHLGPDFSLLAKRKREDDDRIAQNRSLGAGGGGKGNRVLGTDAAADRQKRIREMMEAGNEQVTKRASTVTEKEDVLSEEVVKNGRGQVSERSERALIKTRIRATTKQTLFSFVWLARNQFLSDFATEVGESVSKEEIIMRNKKNSQAF